jgi:hypothetical protein
MSALPIPEIKIVNPARVLWHFLAAWLALIVCASYATAFDGGVWLSVMGGAWTPQKLAPVAWYAAEDNALDSAGAYDGTWAGTAAYTNGVVARGFRSSLGNFVDTGIPSNSAIVSNAFTIFAWFRQTTLIGQTYAGDRIVSMARAAETSGRCGMGVANNGTFALFLVNTSNAAFECQGAAVGIGTWYHGAMVWDGAVLAGYINGAASCAITNSMAAGSSVPVRIGSQTSSLRPFDGSIDDVLIFDRALTATEISKLYNESVKQSARGTAW